MFKIFLLWSVLSPANIQKKKKVLPSSSTIVPLNCEDYNSEKLMAVYSALWSVYILVITLSNI